MIHIAPQARLQLRHAAHHAAVADDGRLAVVSSSGVGTFLGPDLAVLSEFSIPQRPSHAALSPDGSLLAVTTPDGITMYSTAAVNKTFEKVHSMNDAYEYCLFASDGLFWTSSRFTPLTAVLEVWDLSTKTKIAKVKIADPFGGSRFLLFPHVLPKSVVVWAAAGQDGQILFWASLDGERIQVNRFEEQSSTTPPAFRPDGKEFVTADEGALCRYAYPNGPLLARIDQLPEDEYVGDFAAYLDDERALLKSIEEKMFIVDVVEMKVVDEVSLVGEDLAPLFYFVRLADGRFLSIHRDFTAKDIDQTVDSLAIWTIPAWR